MELLERESDLRELGRLLDDAAARHGRMLFLGGEAGVGKTSLVDAFLRQVDSGVDAVRSSCDALSTPGPLSSVRAHATALGIDFQPHLREGQFRDDLFHAMYDAINPLRRRLLHGQVLAMLRDAPDRQRHLATLAHHVELAGDREATLEYAAAAQQARDLGAHREAAQQYAPTLRHGGGLSPSNRAGSKLARAGDERRPAIRIHPASDTEEATRRDDVPIHPRGLRSRSIQPPLRHPPHLAGLARAGSAAGAPPPAARSGARSIRRVARGPRCDARAANRLGHDLTQCQPGSPPEIMQP
jgi:hypothetical protein